MPRPILDEARIHPAIRDTVANFKSDILHEVQAALVVSPIVVVGMRQNPFPKKACKLLESKGIKFQYLEYGSYLANWRDRLALKMWTGWPTFPMVFVKGEFIGGYQDLAKLVEAGDLKV